MKKITGILVITVLSMALFFSANISDNANGDISLASIAEAHAVNGEQSEPDVYWCAVDRDGRGSWILVGHPCYDGASGDGHGGDAPGSPGAGENDEDGSNATWTGTLDVYGVCWIGGITPDCNPY